MPRSDLTNVHNNPAAKLQIDQKSTWFLDDDDWEYEYDEEETEDIYLTLDLTTHLPDALVKREAAANGTVQKGNLDLRLKEFKRMNKTPVDLQSPQARAPIEQQDSPVRPESLQVPTESQGQDGTPTSVPTAITNTLQIVGLHTPSPYIMFNDKFCTSYWLTDLGSQIWVSRPGLSETPAWSGNHLDIVGLSRVRLLAKPAKIEPRYDNEPEIPAAEAIELDPALESAHQPTPPDGQDPMDIDEPVQQIVITNNGVLEPHIKLQAAFMERLSALKIKKGEPDQMPIYSVKAYEFPVNAAEIRAKAWDAEDAERDRIEGPADPSLPRLIREPNQPGRRYSKPGSRLGLKSGSRRGNNSAERDEDADSAEDDDIISPEPQTPSAEGTPAAEEAPITQKRGAQKRSAKMASLGLTSQTFLEGGRPPKRKRRSKLEMAAVRAEEAAARAKKTASLQAEM